ncbi:CASP-like protein 4D1 [Gossypium hirsutum]|uniref:CASP-like protein n=1 Tax=Gossypium hirsutum TaxID=3635 RepID=A0ABM3AT42_GOSHI|nr:CASP-like protein 4D1 [Gossypium hirsutum]
MAPPPTSTISPIIITLVLKILMLVLLLASLVVLATDTATLSLSFYTTFVESKIHFDDVYTYRYVLASIIMGLVYSVLQTALSLYHIATGKRLIIGDGAFLVDFYGDKVISYVLATGSAAGFGATKDLKALADVTNVDDLDDYFDKAYASASLLLFAFICAAILSVFSSYALPKMNNQLPPIVAATLANPNPVPRTIYDYSKPTLTRAESSVINGVSEDAVRQRLFPFSLRNKAKQWLNSLPRGFITTWDQMTEKFLLKYSPPDKITMLRTY